MLSCPQAGTPFLSSALAWTIVLSGWQWFLPAEYAPIVCVVGGGGLLANGGLGVQRLPFTSG
jgi:hypothetical protein